MGLFRWRGNGAGTKTAWNDGRNWVDVNGTAYSQARYPGSDSNATDDAILDAALGSGASSLAGYNGASLKLLNSFTVGSEYDGSAGTVGSYLILPADKVYIDADGSTGVYYQGDSDGDQKIIINSGNSVYLNGYLDIDAKGGTVTVSSTATINGLVTGYLTGLTSDLTMTIEAGASFAGNPTFRGGTITINGGTFTVPVGTSTIWNYGANLTMTDLDVEGFIQSAGNTVWNGGDIGTLLTLQGGTFDGSQSDTPRLITGDITVYSGATLDLNNSTSSIAIEGTITPYGEPDITMPDGRAFELAGTVTNSLGIAPQSLTAGSGARSTTVEVNPFDTVNFYAFMGTGDSNVGWAIYESATYAMSSATIVGSITTHLSTQDGTMKTLSVNGWDITYPFVAVFATASGGAASPISAQIVKKSI